MFRILESQMLELGRDTQQRFIAMMARYMRTAFPSFVARIGDDALVGWLQGALAVAERSGVDTEPEAAQLILLLMVLDDQTPWVEAILTDRHLEARGKVVQLIAEGRTHEPSVMDVVVYEGLS